MKEANKFEQERKNSDFGDFFGNGRCNAGNYSRYYKNCFAAGKS